MLKVTVGEHKPQEKPFPKLMKSSYGDLFIFYCSKVGIPITGEHGHDHLKGWAESWVMEEFTDYNEPITIQNA
jgi:hypothetical protein